MSFCTVEELILINRQKQKFMKIKRNEHTLAMRMPGKSGRPGDQVAGKLSMFLGNLREKMRKKKEKKREK